MGINFSFGAPLTEANGILDISSAAVEFFIFLFSV